MQHHSGQQQFAWPGQPGMTFPGHDGGAQQQYMPGVAASSPTHNLAGGPSDPSFQGVAATPTSPPRSSSTSSTSGGPLEQARIALLLDINALLLAEVTRLQETGAGGAVNIQSLKPGQKMASDDYIQCLRRLQANLAYLMPRAQRDKNPEAANRQPPAGPAFMTPPPAAENLDELRDKYEALRQLFPGWQGLEHRMSGSGASPQVGSGGFGATGPA